MYIASKIWYSLAPGREFISRSQDYKANLSTTGLPRPDSCEMGNALNASFANCALAEIMPLANYFIMIKSQQKTHTFNFNN